MCARETFLSLNLSHVTCMYMCVDVEAGPSQAARGKFSKKGLSSSCGYVYACMCARETFSKLEFISLHACTCMQMWKLVTLKLLVANPLRKVCCHCVCWCTCVYACVCKKDFLKA